MAYRTTARVEALQLTKAEKLIELTLYGGREWPSKFKIQTQKSIFKIHNSTRKSISKA